MEARGLGLACLGADAEQVHRRERQQLLRVAAGGGGLGFDEGKDCPGFGRESVGDGVDRLLGGRFREQHGEVGGQRGEAEGGEGDDERADVGTHGRGRREEAKDGVGVLI